MSTTSRVAGVLRSFTADAREASVTGVAALLGVPKSTASRLLKSMAEEGLLEAAGASRRYRPGPLIAALARTGQADSPLIARLHAMLVPVVRECGHTGYVSVREGTEIRGVRIEEGWQDLRLATPAGTRFPAAATAVGRALLARLADRQVAALLPERLDPPSATAPATRGEVLARLARVRAEGFAEADDEGHRGVGTIAVAVSDPAGTEIAAACISFPRALIDAAGRARIRRLLLDGAREVGAALGDPAWANIPPERRTGT